MDSLVPNLASGTIAAPAPSLAEPPLHPTQVSAIYPSATLHLTIDGKPMSLHFSYTLGKRSARASGMDEWQVRITNYRDPVSNTRTFDLSTGSGPSPVPPRPMWCLQKIASDIALNQEVSAATESALDCIKWLRSEGYAESYPQAASLAVRLDKTEARLKYILRVSNDDAHNVTVRQFVEYMESLPVELARMTVGIGRTPPL
jgi:hypothetical protein